VEEIITIITMGMKGMVVHAKKCMQKTDYRWWGV
jgi:hypothetical protein